MFQDALVQVGAPYQYPESLIRSLIDIKHFLRVGYRQVQGIVKALSRRVKAPDYTTVWERGSRMMRPSIAETIGELEDGVVLALDATGVKVHNRGEWIRSYTALALGGRAT